ncbi:MAG TPA: hypothetical protein VMR81_02025 [Patescibacteria group bacterium]|jgi:hypothetical protein|nr:hypothetical protein [Patescibacteria group bacterium]
MKLLAQGTGLGTIGGEGLGPFGKSVGPNAGLTGILNIISSIVGMLTICASIWFLFMILFAGYEWTSAGGDTKKIASARDRIVHAFIGLVIVVGAWSLTAVVGQFFGFNTLVDPGAFITNLQIH